MLPGQYSEKKEFKLSGGYNIMMCGGYTNVPVVSFVKNSCSCNYRHPHSTHPLFFHYVTHRKGFIPGEGLYIIYGATQVTMEIVGIRMKMLSYIYVNLVKCSFLNSVHQSSK